MALRQRTGGGRAARTGRARTTALGLVVAAALTSACGSTGGPAASGTAAGPPATSASSSAPPGPTPSASSPSAPASVRVVDAAEAAAWAAPLTKAVTKDEFADNRNGWTTHGGETWKLEITGGQYVWTEPPGADSDEEPSVLEATPAQVGAYRVSSRATTTDIASVGFDCAFDDSGDIGQSYYRLSVTREGPQITMRRNGSPSVVLASAEAPQLSDGVPVAFEAVCVQQDGEYRLGLLVDGEPVLAVIDSDPLDVTVPSAFWTRALPPDQTDKGVAAYDYYRMYAGS